MRRLASIVAVALMSLGLAPPIALAAFGFEEVDSFVVTDDADGLVQAGSHPFVLKTSLRLNTVEEAGLESPDGNLRDLQIEYPAGFVAMPWAVPRCSAADFAQIQNDQNACPDSTAVGIAEVTASAADTIPAGSEDFLDSVPMYNLLPLSGKVARIGFVAAGQPVTVEFGIRDAPPYNGFAAISDFSQSVLLYSARISIWGTPADSAHDADRGQCVLLEASCPVAIPERPFLTVSRSCTGPLATIFNARSWQEPAQWITAMSISSDGSEPSNPIGLAGCGSLSFQPQIDVQPTTDLAETPTGLDFSIGIPPDGFLTPSGLGQSEAKKLVLALPEGMSLNPAVTGDTVTCTADQYAEETIEPAPGEGCPQASEVGTIEVESPLLEGEVGGGRSFLAQHGSALYLVIRDPELGILVKQEGEVGSDPIGDELTITFDQIPQLPFSQLRIHLDEDPGALITPATCGDFTAKATFDPWADPSRTTVVISSFEITAGMEGGPCPSDEEEPPSDPDVGDPSSTVPHDPLPMAAGPPSATTPPETLVLPPVASRHCPKGKRRVQGKVRCVRKRCSQRAASGPRDGDRRTLVRACARSRGSG